MSLVSVLDLGQSQSDSALHVPISNSYPSYHDSLRLSQSSSEIKSSLDSSSSETEPSEAPVVIGHSSPLRAKRSEPSRITGNLDSSEQCPKKSRSFNPDAPAQNMTTWPQHVQRYSSRLAIISSAPTEQQPQPSAPASQLPSFSSLTSTLSSRSLPKLPARRPPIPLLSSSATQTTLFRLTNRSTGKYAPSYSLLNQNTSALNVLEICSGDIFSFFDNKNMLIIPQRVLLVGRVLEGVNGIYRFPCLHTPDPICIRANYEAAELRFRCVTVQRSSVRLIAKDPSMKGADSGPKTNDSGSKKSSSTLFCPLHEQPTSTSFTSNKTRLISLIRTLSPEIFQHRMEVIRREDPNRWKFYSSAEKSVILRIARVDELLYLLPSQCTCLSETQRQNIHRLARVKMNSKPQEPMESAYEVRINVD